MEQDDGSFAFSHPIPDIGFNSDWLGSDPWTFNAYACFIQTPELVCSSPQEFRINLDDPCSEGVDFEFSGLPTELSPEPYMLFHKD